MQKVYISSTYKDFREYRSTLISLFHKQLKGKFELCEIMEHMFDDGSSSTYVEECVEAVKECDIYFIILGNSVGSYPPNESRTYTEIEYQTAMEEDKFIYRLQLENIDPKTIDDPAKHKALRDSFEGKHVTYFNDEAELEGIFLKSLLNHFKEINTDNPYIGSDPFKIDQGGYFFGREDEIEKFIKLILTTENRRVFSVVGDSGVGKSSFISAGVMHRMLEEEVMGYSEHIPLVLRPGDQPLTNLKYLLRRHAGIHGQDLSAKDFEGAKILLFIDHLEELFTQCKSEASCSEVSAFVQLMNELAAHPDLDLIIFLSLRSDMAEKLSAYPFIGQYSKEFELGSFDFKKNDAQWEQAITDIITAPAAKHGVSLESELVSSLVKELEQLDGALPILQMTLYQIWDPKVIKDHQIKYSELLKLSRGKGLIGLLQNHANSVASRITSKGRDKVKENILKSMLVNLVEVSDEHGDLKRTLSKRKLFEKLDQYPQHDVEAVFEDLISAKSRLLVVAGRELNCEPSESEDEGSCVTIIHGGLIRKWPKLQQWVEERREALNLQKRLMSDVRDYEEKKGRLYRGKRLRTALGWQKNNRDFWDHSIHEFLKKSKIRRLYTYAIPLLILAIGVVLKMTWYDQKIKKDAFLYEVIAAKPELLQNFLKAKADLMSPQTLSLASGSFEELNGSVTRKLDFPLKRNLRFFNKVDGLVLKNNPEITEFREIEKEISEHGSFSEFAEELHYLTLQKLSHLVKLDGIDKLNQLHSLSLINNFTLQLEPELALPQGLRYLQIDNNDKLSALPDLSELKELDSLRIVGNDTLLQIKGGFPDGLSRILISGNSRLDSVTGLDGVDSLKHLSIDYNDALTQIEGIDKLTQLEEIVVKKNPRLLSFPSFKNNTSLKKVELGVPSFKSLPVMPNGITELILSDNAALESADLTRLTNLKSVIVEDNRVLDDLKLPNGIRELIIQRNRSLRELDLKKGDSLQKLILKGNQNLVKLPDFKKLKVSRVVLDSLPRLGSLIPLHQGYKPTDIHTIDSVEIYKLAYLTKLWTVSDLKTLKYLKIQGEKFEYNFDVAEGKEPYKYPVLEELILHSNTTYDLDYLPAIKRIPSLKKLVAKDNLLVLGFQELDLENLEELILENNKNFSIMPDFSALPSLKNLKIVNHPGLDEIVDFSNARALRRLELSGNPSITNFVADSLDLLEELTLKDNTRLVNYDSIAKLSSLKMLHLENSFQLLSNLKFATGLTNLQEVRLINNKTLERISALQNSKQLRKLHLHKNYHLSLLPNLSQFDSLQELRITENSYLSDLPGFNDKLISRLDKLILLRNSQLVWNKVRGGDLSWKKFHFQHLELDIESYRQLFLNSEVLKDNNFFRSKNQIIDTLVIHYSPGDDLKPLLLPELKQRNPELVIDLRLDSN